MSESDCKKWTFIPYWFTRNNLNSKRSVSFLLSILISKECMTSLSKSRWRFSAAFVSIEDTKNVPTLTTLQYRFEKSFRNLLGAWILSRKSFAYDRKRIRSKQLLWKCALARIRCRSIIYTQYSPWLNIVVNIAKTPSVSQGYCSSLAISSSAASACSSTMFSHDSSIMR